MSVKRKTTVDFGGEAHELWTERGLEVSYTGRTAVTAEFDGKALRAEAPEPERGGDVKAGYNKLAKSLELAVRLNAGAVSALTSAYFHAAAELGVLLGSRFDWHTLPERFHREISGGADVIGPVELLRMLLDEKRATWDEACYIVSRCYTLRLDGSGITAPVPLAAVKAIQMRDASLITAVNEKFCARLWKVWPGDWLRIGESAVVRDGEADLTLLSAVMCSRVFCAKEGLVGALRTLYTVEPARFVEI